MDVPSVRYLHHPEDENEASQFEKVCRAVLYNTIRFFVFNHVRFTQSGYSPLIADTLDGGVIRETLDFAPIVLFPKPEVLSSFLALFVSSGLPMA